MKFSTFYYVSSMLCPIFRKRKKKNKKKKTTYNALEKIKSNKINE